MFFLLLFKVVRLSAKMLTYIPIKEKSNQSKRPFIQALAQRISKLLFANVTKTHWLKLRPLVYTLGANFGTYEPPRIIFKYFKLNLEMINIRIIEISQNFSHVTYTWIYKRRF